MTKNNEKIVPNLEDSMHGDQGYTPVDEGKRRWSALRLALIWLNLIACLTVVYFALATNRKPDGPTLESRFQQQHQLIDQLRGQLDDLQADQQARAIERESIASRLEKLATRAEANERFQQGLDRQALPAQIDALTKRLDALSGSVDLRFNAAQEKDHSLEASIEEIRKLQASHQQKARSRHSKPMKSTLQRAETQKPPFNVTGLEMRGGRSYLAIGSGPVGRLSDLHLIDEGQSVGGWQLTSIDGHSASFTFNGQRVVVTVP